MDSVTMDNSVVSHKPEKRKMSSSRKKKIIFFFLMTAPFLLQAAIFYVYVNISTIGLAFLEYHLGPTGDVSTFVWFKNFAFVFDIIKSPAGIEMILVSLLMYGFILLVVTPVVIFFSFYIYKRYFLSSFFRVILFMPQIISGVVYVRLYKMMLGPISGQLFGFDVFGSTDTTAKLIALIAYVFWTGFGTNILLMSGAMSGIDDSVVEACYLDGCNMTKEFIFVTLPSIYPTITTFIVLDLTTIFTNTMNMHMFFGNNSPIKSVGYYMEINMLFTKGLYDPPKTDNSIVNPNETKYLLYPQLAALGLMITITVAPLCILVRKFMERVGPSED